TADEKRMGLAKVRMFSGSLSCLHPACVAPLDALERRSDVSLAQRHCRVPALRATARNCWRLCLFVLREG
uniref:Uncharacterized protein n=1 Tax=Accipiter nisus TaxID=211598 RepID=A0A8B9RRQ8_9AVES